MRSQPEFRETACGERSSATAFVILPDGDIRWPIVAQTMQLMPARILRARPKLGQGGVTKAL
jgi:hypothetical protein